MIKKISSENILKFIRTNYGYIERNRKEIAVKYKDGEKRMTISKVILRNLLSDKLIRKISETQTAEIFKPNFR